MKVHYGIPGKYIDVTERTFLGFDRSGNRVKIPAGDHLRGVVYGDPVPGIVKHIVIDQETDNETLYGVGEEFYLEIPEEYLYLTKVYRFDGDTTKRLQEIHSRLKFSGGSLTEEYPEQLMSVRFIRPDAKVLEIGANMGRNTVVIASLLKDSSNLVTLETLSECIPVLVKNREENNLHYTILNAALSKKPLYQSGWDAIPSDAPIEGKIKVHTIDYNFLPWRPDTIVADCEGSLFYIFQDYQEILDDISLIIMENDYWEIEKKRFVDSLLIAKGFRRVFSQGGGWGPCAEFFFETWAKIPN